MADYAIGLSFHKAHRTIVRAIGLNAPCRYFADRDAAGFITLPVLDIGDAYVEIQGVTQTNFQINDNNQEFRLLGDDGWNDSVITGSGVQASCTTFFLKDSEVPGGAQCPQFRGNYDEGFALIERARYDKDFEIYIEFLKELGQSDGNTGDWVYDFTGFNAVIQNYAENMNAEGLTEVTFDLVSRGRPVFGRLNNGGNQIEFGQVQSTLLFLTAGSRQVAFLPADNADAVAVDGNLTATYTSDGSTALTELQLGDADGDGYALFVNSTGVRVPATVTLAANVVTVNPDVDLTAGTIYELRVADGAVKQSVNSSGVADAAGVARPIQGQTITFKTA